MAWLITLLNFVWPFLVLLTPLVFFHELGHYLVARYFGVKVDVFSIGLGPEIFGWHDRSGTRWKLSWIPLGGYVKMYGDEDVSSRPTSLQSVTLEKSHSLTMQSKTPLQKIAISIAGPFANYVLAIVCFFVVFMVRGLEHWEPVLQSPLENSLAVDVGFKAQDRIVSINSQPIKNFEDVVSTIKSSRGQDLDVEVSRHGAILNLHVDASALAQNGHRLGVAPLSPVWESVGPVKAFVAACERVVFISVNMLSHIWGMLTRQISSEEMGSVLMVAQLANEVSKAGLISFLLFFSVLSVNLGLINLMPIPMLDGGHIPLYIYEMIVGKPLPDRAIEWIYRVGLFVIVGLFFLATWNDSRRLGILSFFERLFS